MANRRISDLQELAGIDVAEQDLFTIVHVFEVDPALKNKKITISGTKEYLNLYYLPRTGGTISGSTTVSGTFTATSGNFVSGVSSQRINVGSGAVFQPFFYSPSPDQVALSINNTDRLNVNSNGFAAYNGAIGRGAPVTKTNNFTLGITENWIVCSGAAAITATLPAASAWTGREIMVKTVTNFAVVSSAANIVPLTGGSVSTAILSAAAGKYAALVSDGTNWITMESN
jgi:hypothetical protein